MVIGFVIQVFVDYRGLFFALCWGVLFFWDFARRTQFDDVACWWWGLAGKSALLELFVGEC